MKLNSGTGWGVFAGTVVGILLAVTLGPEDLESQGATVFTTVLVGAAVGTVLHVLIARR